jgi:hypothetical protein
VETVGDVPLDDKREGDPRRAGIQILGAPAQILSVRSSPRTLPDGRQVPPGSEQLAAASRGSAIAISSRYCRPSGTIMLAVPKFGGRPRESRAGRIAREACDRPPRGPRPAAITWSTTVGGSRFSGDCVKSGIRPSSLLMCGDERS